MDELTRATLRLESLQLFVDVGGASHVVPVGALEAASSMEGTTWGDSGRSTWTELTLHLGPDGRLWVAREDWEDIHLAGAWPDPKVWFVSSDGAAWTPAAAPAELDRLLGRVKT